jgi:uncharacterized integral membrane protein
MLRMVIVLFLQNICETLLICFELYWLAGLLVLLQRVHGDIILGFVLGARCLMLEEELVRKSELGLSLSF